MATSTSQTQIIIVYEKSQQALVSSPHSPAMVKSQNLPCLKSLPPTLLCAIQEASLWTHQEMPSLQTLAITASTKSRQVQESSPWWLEQTNSPAAIMAMTSLQRQQLFLAPATSLLTNLETSSSLMQAIIASAR
jgi:hypothetical protein